ncbi:MAG: tetratricopeptide repeat protein, partial [Verrucomicrobiota bacterium]
WSAILIRMKRFGEAAELLATAEKLNAGNLTVRFNQEVLSVLRGEASGQTEFWRGMFLEQLDVVAQWLLADREALVEAIGEPGFVGLVQRILGGPCENVLDLVVADLTRLRTARKYADWEGVMDQVLKIRSHKVDSMSLELELLTTILNLGEKDKALRLTQLLIQKYPTDYRIWYNYGSVLSSTEQHEEALVAFSETYLLNPDWGQGRFALGYTYAALGQI